MELEVFSVPVTDQDRAKNFYLKVGFNEITDRQMGNGIRWVQRGLPGAKTSIALVNWYDDMKPGTLRGMFIGTDEFDAERTRLERLGVSYGMQEQTPVGRFAKFTDPDGNRWTLRGE